MEHDLRLKRDSTNHQKQQNKAAAEEEELVKYMSNLPSYLEKGKMSQEKALNVGVLDWRRLEKWQCRHSLSSNDTNTTPSSFPIGRSTANTSRGPSCSPPDERIRQRSLQFHLISSTKNENPRVVKLSEERAGTSQGNSITSGHSTFKMHTEIKSIQQKIIDSYPKTLALDKRVNFKGAQVKAMAVAKDGECIHKKSGYAYDAVSSGVPHSCPLLPFEIETLQSTNHSPENRESLSLSRVSFPSALHAAKMGMSPTHGKFPEVKRSGIAPENSTSKECNVRGDVKLSKVAADRPRSTSPFARLGIGVSRMRKTFTSKEGSSLEQSSSTYNSTRSCPRASTSCQHNSSYDTQSGTSRARSSPLRRLLDPLLKPKAPSFHLPQDPLQRDSISRGRTCKFSDGQQSNFSNNTSQPGMVKLDVSCKRAVNNNVSSPDKQNIRSTLQALLRVAVKNGQPLFTFAVDKESDVLAATMKNLSTSREDEYSCIYTFFAIQEVKKKNGRWINQGGKEKNHDYVPNVVAQLRVSGSQFSTSKSQDYVEQSFAREFILFAVDLQQAGQHASDPQPNNELAAIIVKVPKVISQRTVNVQSEPEVGIRSPVSTTVILPSGVHSLPSRGGPSSLIQRWRSGGSCDCGGWDLGCELRILANKQSQLPEKSSTSDKFELISQGGEASQLFFSLAPFKDGIYSVEFSSTISVLQAFALCIAVLDGKNLCEESKTNNISGEKTSQETMAGQNGVTRASSGYISYPPHSPVGRA